MFFSKAGGSIKGFFPQDRLPPDIENFIEIPFSTVSAGYEFRNSIGRGGGEPGEQAHHAVRGGGDRLHHGGDGSLPKGRGDPRCLQRKAGCMAAPIGEVARSPRSF